MSYSFNKKFVTTLAVLAVATIGVFGMAGEAQAVRGFNRGREKDTLDYTFYSI